MEYQDLLKIHVNNIADLKGKSLLEIFKESKGAFPTEIFNALAPDIRYHLKNDRMHIFSDDLLPKPTIVDFEWRFNNETIDYIVNKVPENVKRVALLGVPSIYQKLLSTDLEVHLFDINDLLRKLPSSETKKVFIIDLNSGKVQIDMKYDLIIIDPPWYLDVYKKWVSQAYDISRIGSIIFISLFQELLRPNADKERRELIRIFETVGDTIIEENKILYRTPLYEWQVLRQAKLAVEGDWRVADLAIINVNTLKSIEFEYHSYVTTNWKRILFKEQTIAIQEDNDLSQRISLSSVYEDGTFYLKSVSNRDPHKSKANLITSSGVIMKVTGIEKIARALVLLKNGRREDDLIYQLDLDNQEYESLINILNLIENPY